MDKCRSTVFTDNPRMFAMSMLLIPSILLIVNIFFLWGGILPISSNNLFCMIAASILRSMSI